MTRARGASILAVSGFLVAIPAAAQPAPSPKACIAAADEGQKLRDEGKLNAAREKFIACSSKQCPSVVAKECTQWLDQAERDLPTITFKAIDEQGKETLEVRVVVDGATVSKTIDAHPLALDPGEHTVRYERADGKAVEDKVLLRPGEKNRIVQLAFEAPQSSSPPVAAGPAPASPQPPPGSEEQPKSFQVPLLGWVGVGVGAVGILGTVLFATSAKSDEEDLRSTCAPNCPSSEKSAIDTKLVLANVSLGVGLVGLGVAVVTTVMANTGGKKPASTGARTSVNVHPTPSGGAIGVSGTF